MNTTQNTIQDNSKTNTNIDNFLSITDVALTNEEIAKFFLIGLNTAKDHSNAVATFIINAITPQLNENNELLNTVNTKIAELRTSINDVGNKLKSIQKWLPDNISPITEIMKSNSNTIASINNQINDQVTNQFTVTRNTLANNTASIASLNNSIAELKESINDIVADKTTGKTTGKTTDTTTSYSNFQFVSKLTQSQRDNWRKCANANVLRMNGLCGYSYGEGYSKIYKDIEKVTGINVYELHHLNKNKYDSTIKTVAASDYLMHHFDMSLKNVLGLFTNNQQIIKTYKSDDVRKCPDIIKDQVRRFCGKYRLGKLDYAKLYKVVAREINMSHVIKSAMSTTGFNVINRWFALAIFPGGYEQLVKIINKELNKKETNNK